MIVPLSMVFANPVAHTHTLTDTHRCTRHTRHTDTEDTEDTQTQKTHTQTQSINFTVLLCTKVSNS